MLDEKKDLPKRQAKIPVEQEGVIKRLCRNGGCYGGFV